MTRGSTPERGIPDNNTKKTTTFDNSPAFRIPNLRYHRLPGNISKKNASVHIYLVMKAIFHLLDYVSKSRLAHPGRKLHFHNKAHCFV